MIRDIVEAARAELRLLEEEVEYFLAAGSVSFDAMYGLLEAAPSLERLRPGIRRRLLLDGLRDRLISPDYRRLLDSGWTAPPRATGAEPSPAEAPAVPGLPVRPLPGQGMPQMLEGEPRFDLPGELHEVWPLTDQGNGPTCIAEATAACLEWQEATRRGGGVTMLAPEFLHARMRARLEANPPNPPPPGFAQGATRFADAAIALMAEGICRETTWSRPGLTPQARLVAALAEAPQRRLSPGNSLHVPLPPGTPRSGVAWAVLELLRGGGHPVGIAVPVFRDPASTVSNWQMGHVWQSGIVQDPVPPLAPATVGHAVAVVGFVPVPGEARGGWFIFRNSWGSDFGIAAGPRGGLSDMLRIPRSGYGAISASHVDRHCWEILLPGLA